MAIMRQDDTSHCSENKKEDNYISVIMLFREPVRTIPELVLESLQRSLQFKRANIQRLNGCLTIQLSLLHAAGFHDYFI